jgi:hypothetical protein
MCFPWKERLAAGRAQESGLMFRLLGELSFKSQNVVQFDVKMALLLISGLLFEMVRREG